MTNYQRIDATATVADQPLDTFLIVRTAQNLRSIREERGRSASWTPGTLNSNTGAVLRPEISSFRGPCWIPFFYHLADRTTQLTVSIRGRCATSVAGGGGATELVLSAFVMSVQDYFASLPFGVGAATANVTGAASSSATTDLQIDTTNTARGWVMVWVGFESTAAAAVEITNAGGTAGPAIFLGALPGCYILDAAANLGAGDALNHWGLSVKTTGGGKDNDFLFDRKLLYQDYSAARPAGYEYLLYCWPPLTGLGWTGSIEGAASSVQQHSATDALFYIPLGVYTLDSITLRDSAVSSPYRSGRLDAGRPAAVRPMLPEVQAIQDVWTANTRIHHIGPSQNPTETGLTSYVPSNLISGSRVLADATTYLDLCSAIVGDDDGYTNGASNYLRSQVTVKLLLLLTLPVNNHSLDVPLTFDIDFRIRHSTQHATANAQTAVWSGVPVQALPVMKYSTSPIASTVLMNPDAENYGSESWWYGFQKSGVIGNSRSTHVGRGVHPIGGTFRGIYSELELTTKDTLSSTNDLRLLQLQAKLNRVYSIAPYVGRGVTNEGLPTQYKPRLHILTWTVITTPYFGSVDPTVLGA